MFIYRSVKWEWCFKKNPWDCCLFKAYMILRIFKWKILSDLNVYKNNQHAVKTCTRIVQKYILIDEVNRSLIVFLILKTNTGWCPLNNCYSTAVSIPLSFKNNFSPHNCTVMCFLFLIYLISSLWAHFTKACLSKFTFSYEIDAMDAISKSYLNLLKFFEHTFVIRVIYYSLVLMCHLYL